MKKKETAASRTLSRMQINEQSTGDSLPSAAHRKLSFSLFPPDVEAADYLVGLLWDCCKVRATRSDAVKMALRFTAAQITHEAVKAGFAAIKSEDRRSRGSA